MYLSRSQQSEAFNSKIQPQIDNCFHSIGQLTSDCINFAHHSLRQNSSIHFNLGQDKSIHLSTGKEQEEEKTEFLGWRMMGRSNEERELQTVVDIICTHMY